MMDDRLLKQYLLGELPPEEQQRLEEQFFNGVEEFEHLTVLEDELIDDYLCGDLSPQQCQQFEKHFLVSPERRERLAAANALVATISTKPKAVAPPVEVTPWWEPIFDFFKFGNPAIRYAMVAASLIILTFYSARETLENQNLRQQLYQLENRQGVLTQSTEEKISQARQRTQQLQAEFDTHKQQSAEREQQLSDLLEPQPYLLAASTTRSGTQQGQSLKDLQVTRDDYWIKLQLEFDKSTAFPDYRVGLQTETGDIDIWSQGRLQAQTLGNVNTIIFMIPVSIFIQSGETAQRYKLALWGISAEEELWIVETYTFRVAIK